MTDQPVRPLEALIAEKIAEWRGHVSADRARADEVGDYLEGKADGAEECADELAALLQAAAPPAPTAEPRYAEDSIRQFIGWLSVDIPELHAVVIPDLADSWERFKQRMLGAAPPERVSEGKE